MKKEISENLKKSIEEMLSNGDAVIVVGLSTFNSRAVLDTSEVEIASSTNKQATIAILQVAIEKMIEHEGLVGHA